MLFKVVNSAHFDSKGLLNYCISALQKINPLPSALLAQKGYFFIIALKWLKPLSDQSMINNKKIVRMN